MEDFLREDDQATIARLHKELSATNEALKRYVDYYLKADDRLCSLKKEVEETRWEVLSRGQRYERVLGELMEVKKERDAIKKENEALKEENAKPEDGAARWRGK